MYWDDNAYNSPSQPIVGICWHEARAYCAWLSAQVSGSPRPDEEGADQRSDGVRVFKLPTEAEWEAAARGQQARRYPYGGDFDVALGNTFESHIRRTTPVGVFPGGETPTGLIDISGNVYDWTSTIYRDYPYQPGDGREDSASADPDARRVVRGGSWSYSNQDSRCAARFRDLSAHRSYVIGFRVVCGVPSSLAVLLIAVGGGAS